jgi:hypothetical protein
MFARPAILEGAALATAISVVGSVFGRDEDAVGEFRHNPFAPHQTLGGFVDGDYPAPLTGGFSSGGFDNLRELNLVESHKKLLSDVRS